MTGQTLYERLGGVNAIAMVVDRFSDESLKKEAVLAARNHARKLGRAGGRSYHWRIPLRNKEFEDG